MNYWFQTSASLGWLSSQGYRRIVGCMFITLMLSSCKQNKKACLWLGRRGQHGCPAGWRGGLGGWWVPKSSYTDFPVWLAVSPPRSIWQVRIVVGNKWRSIVQITYLWFPQNLILHCLLLGTLILWFSFDCEQMGRHTLEPGLSRTLRDYWAQHFLQTKC